MHFALSLKSYDSPSLLKELLQPSIKSFMAQKGARVFSLALSKLYGSREILIRSSSYSEELFYILGLA